jgi:hypothetical protein
VKDALKTGIQLSNGTVCNRMRARPRYMAEMVPCKGCVGVAEWNASSDGERCLSEAAQVVP